PVLLLDPTTRAAAIGHRVCLVLSVVKTRLRRHERTSQKAEKEDFLSISLF
ncbi:hypothetical protein NDU88_000819, partial [Pleurodeles waltl]